MSKKIELERVENYGHPQTLAYKRFFYRNAILGVLRPHKIVFSHPRYGRDNDFFLNPRVYKRWQRVFNIPDVVKVPFTYSDFSRAVGLMMVIQGLGVNFRYLLHLKSEFWFYKPLVPGEHYIIDYVFEDVIRIKQDKGALVGHSAIKQNGRLYLKSRDHMVIKEVDERYLQRLKIDETNQFKGITKIPAEPIKNADNRDMYIPGNMARRYSKTSGDYNIVHTSKGLAKAFGYDHPFIQGMCTANLIMKELVMAGINLEYFSITFCRPVLLRSQVTLYFNDSAFQLQDEDSHILCFGEINTNNSAPDITSSEIFS